MSGECQVNVKSQSELDIANDGLETCLCLVSLHSMNVEGESVECVVFE